MSCHQSYQCSAQHQLSKFPCLYLLFSKDRFSFHCFSDIKGAKPEFFFPSALQMRKSMQKNQLYPALTFSVMFMMTFPCAACARTWNCKTYFPVHYPSLQENALDLILWMYLLQYLKLKHNSVCILVKIVEFSIKKHMSEINTARRISYWNTVFFQNIDPLFSS